MLKTFKSLLMEGVIKEGNFLDLGCGNGKDALAAAENGFKVTAIDKKISVQDGSVNFIESSMEDFEIEKDKYDVIYADNSLPFVSKDNAKKILEKASDNLKTGGVLYFSLFGVNDAWSGDEKMNFWTKDEATNFIETLGLKLYRKTEEEGFAPKMDGEIKYWHIFRFILKK